MRFVLPLTMLILLAAPTSWAALSTNASTALSFYRNKMSLFPSGQASRTELEAKLLRNETDLSYRASWDNKEYLLEGDQILRDIHVSRFVETKSSALLLASPQSDGHLIKTLNAKAPLEILSTNDYWAQVQDSHSKKVGWIPLHLLQTVHDDVGVYVNIIDTFLRQSAQNSAQVITTIPRLYRTIPLEFASGFIKIKYQNFVGYVDASHFISRADFANLAYHPQKNWLPVTHRSNEFIITQNNLRIPLKELKGFVTTSSRGVVVRQDDPNYGPPIRSRVEIKSPEAHIWGVSRIDGHGEVWWKKKNLILEDTPKNADNRATSLTTDNLLKREIYSIAFENKNSLRGIVSSEGVYRSEDGKTWTLIPQFGKNNLPVSIHPNGTWFVGSYKSSNRGKTFEPFIRWDNIAQAIEDAYHTNPRILRLTQIEALPNSRVQIYVDTGSKQVKLRSLIGDLRWDVIKN